MKGKLQLHAMRQLLAATPWCLPGVPVHQSLEVQDSQPSKRANKRERGCFLSISRRRLPFSKTGAVHRSVAKKGECLQSRCFTNTFAAQETTSGALKREFACAFLFKQRKLPTHTSASDCHCLVQPCVLIVCVGKKCSYVRELRFKVGSVTLLLVVA